MNAASSLPRQRWTGKLLLFAVMAAVLAGGAWGYREWNRADRLPVEPDASKESPLADAVPDTVFLPENKFNAAGVTTSSVEDRLMQDTRVIAGRIRYNDATHIAVKAPTDGMLIQTFVNVGDKVQAGQTLATFHSQDIGLARADVLRRESELVLAERRENWQREISANLQELLGRLETADHVEDVERDFLSKPLGDYRQMVLSAWLRRDLAEQLANQAAPLSETGAIPKRTLLERETAKRTAVSDYRSMSEQVRFDANQKLENARIETRDARRRLEISRQQLDTLLGFGKDTIRESSGTSLSELEIRAPFAATVESRAIAKSERVAAGETLMVLADTSTLYVEVTIRERDWPAIQFQPGQELTVMVPAIPDRTFKAATFYLGREVKAISNAVPLVATIDNSDGLLRPGMFVRVEVPIGAARTVAAIPREALLLHDGEEFVFVSKGSGQFRRKDVSTGQVTRDWVEIRDGLERGEKVVAQGAFEIKSELLLEGEE